MSDRFPWVHGIVVWTSVWVGPGLYAALTYKMQCTFLLLRAQLLAMALRAFRNTKPAPWIIESLALRGAPVVGKMLR